MKPTSAFKKMCLAGMLASCFFLVNCGPSQNAKDTKAEALKLEELNKQLPKCSDDTMSLLIDRNVIFGTIRDLLSAPLDSAQKEKLQSKINELYSKSKAIMTNVRTSKVNGLPATGCNYTSTDKNGAEAKLTYQLSVMKVEDLALAKKVSKATEDTPNAITQNEHDVWEQQDIVLISSDMARLLSDERWINGKRMITNGRVMGGGQEFNILKRNATASLCYPTLVDGQEVDESGSQATINLSAPRLDNMNRIVVDVTLLVPASYGGNRTFLVSCLLADGTDLNDAMVDTFGDLLKKKPVEAAPAPAEAPAEKVAPAPAKAKE
jgi:hypothetical protein